MYEPDFYHAIESLKRAWIVAMTVTVALIFLVKVFQAELAIERATPGAALQDAMSLTAY
jgi:uncharacterized protein (UPF0212 family)